MTRIHQNCDCLVEWLIHNILVPLFIRSLFRNGVMAHEHFYLCDTHFADLSVFAVMDDMKSNRNNYERRVQPLWE